MELTIESATAAGEMAAGMEPPQPPQPTRTASAELRARRGLHYPPPLGEGAGGEGEGENECVVCMAAPKECVLLECAHACVCEQCAGTLVSCPLCRSEIPRVVRLFQ